MHGDRLSVIISAYRGVENLESCVRALKAQSASPDELVVLHDSLLDPHGGVISVPGCQFIQREASQGIGAARNAAAHATTGEILAFIDGDTVVRPGWAQALRSAFAAGACLAGGAIDCDGAQTLAGRYLANWRRHDEEGRNGFLPLASGTHLAIRRDVLFRLGGFEERGPVSEDVDLSLRAQLAGFPISFVPSAELVHQPGASVGGLLRLGFQRARADRMTEQKFRKFPFMSLDSQVVVTRALASSVVAELLAGGDGNDRRLSRPLLHAGVAGARRLGILATDLQLATRRASLPGAVAYRDPEQHNTSAPLPGAPAFLLLGDDRLVMGLLRLACEGGEQLIVAPPGVEREAMARWDEPAPWSLRLVRTAARAGWPLAVETAAMRVEREQPRTWGEAFLTLHRVHAWAHGRLRYGVAASGPAARQLSERLADVPVVIAGQWGSAAEDRVVLRVTRTRLLREPAAVGGQLSQVIATAPGRDPGTVEKRRGR